MTHQVELVRVESSPTAVIRGQVSQRELSRFVPAACGEVWKFIRQPGMPKPGRNLALYLDGKISLEIGVEVAAPFTGNERVVYSRLPDGLAATTVHFGPYNTLGEAHQAVQKWCADSGHRLSGVSWEMYGHWKEEWNDDPSKIRTDVFYLLRET